ncbi:hypothetical protein K443DRAFT_4904 [Laccaria amethystina LaAM-08-1]|uniref:Prolyl 4-hydroxylase alpha subunit Fe(2+) 2OG dioxygenase domain-containing protein n=1 Tax=Laccaria amethystina LaAM-08-1 TaxID=1095629 RepID=A0A0C9Y225_9AGAR|nr:hypothetical protein K443DRAFT_4904 [Laccaria amethystina LaAM-08-1]
MRLFLGQDLGIRPVFAKPPFARCQQSLTASQQYARPSQTRNHSALARTRYLKTRVSSSFVETKTTSQGPPFFFSSLLLFHLSLAMLSDGSTYPSLLEACDAVLKDNDTDPKAWKLDNPNFSTPFDMLDAGIVEHVRSKLAKGGFVPLERVRAELRELNVHGPGSFVKPDEHNPAPNTFGIPIVRKDNEWTFDSSAPSTTPSVKYIAFYNAVEHELSPITSGHRVSLTYNLSYDDPPLPTGPLRGDAVTEEEAKLRQTLSALIENLDFLPDGGYLGFGLRYQYPIKADLGAWVADELNMNAQLKLVYDDDEDDEDGWGGDAVRSDDEEEKDSDEEQEKGSRTRRILLDDANQYRESTIEDGDPVKVSVASSGGVILCKPDENVKPFKDSTGRPVTLEKCTG